MFRRYIEASLVYYIQPLQSSIRNDDNIRAKIKCFHRTGPEQRRDYGNVEAKKLWKLKNCIENQIHFELQGLKKCWYVLIEDNMILADTREK